MNLLVPGVGIHHKPQHNFGITVTPHERHGVLNPQQFHCLFNPLLRHTSNKTPKLSEGNPQFTGGIGAVLRKILTGCAARFFATPGFYTEILRSKNIYPCLNGTIYPDNRKCQPINYFVATLYEIVQIRPKSYYLKSAENIPLASEPQTKVRIAIVPG